MSCPSSTARTSLVSLLLSIPEQQHGLTHCFFDLLVHAGQVPLDLSDDDACDFFVSNCHKWLFSAKGSAGRFLPSSSPSFPSHGLLIRLFPSSILSHVDP